MEEFLNMGGYAVYVWPSYGLTALFMIALTLSSLHTLSKRKRQLAELEAKRPPRRAPRTAQPQTAQPQTAPTQTAQESSSS